MTAAILVEDLGRRDYGETLELMRALCRDRVEGRNRADRLLLVEHNPVVTLGRSTRASSLPFPPELLESRGIQLFAVERGGDVTLHAPGQLVGYPVLDLTGWRRDLHWYLRQLEEVLIRALARLDISAERNPGRTGVWTGGRKIASIGIHVKQWVTMHGFALNVTTDLSLFDLIVPCGIPDVVMTSIARERPDLAEPWEATGRAVVQAFGDVFERAMVPGPRPARGRGRVRAG
jgi:lipoyl(octanoyl) transferase